MEPPNAPGRLYLCATPIGNLQDITLRCLETLKSVNSVLAEDTRQTRKLLQHFGISVPLRAYHAHNEHQQTPAVLADLKDGKHLALVTDAGMPGLADPGYHLVQAAVDALIPFTVIPGPSAITTALLAAGLPPQPFVFTGFVPRQQGQREEWLQAYQHRPETLICFEAPHRLVGTLQAMQAAWGERPMAVCRELTKFYEETLRGTPAKMLAHFGQHQVRGEITLVIQGAVPQTGADEATLVAEYQTLLGQGLRHKEAIRELSDRYGIARNELYQRLLHS